MSSYLAAHQLVPYQLTYLHSNHLGSLLKVSMMLTELT
jgi:hypothetical protein